jgi:hypothetical protein
LKNSELILAQLSVLSINPREMKTYVCTKPFTQILIAALWVMATISNDWKEHKWSSVGEYLNDPRHP